MQEVLLFCFGLVFGSFSNVLIDRSESGESVIWGRSHCDYCRKTLRWYELIPVISFMLQRGRCRRCKKSLSIQYPLIEILTAVSYVALSFVVPIGELYIVSAAILSACVVIAVSDFKYQLIPDEMVILATMCALYMLFRTQPAHTIALHAYAAIGSVSLFWTLWRVTKGRGMGFGDVKLAAFLGILLGYPGSIFAIYCAFLTGALLGVILIITQQKTLKSKIAFGPFMLLGIFVTLVWYAPLIRLWNIYF